MPFGFLLTTLSLYHSYLSFKQALWPHGQISFFHTRQIWAIETFDAIFELQWIKKSSVEMPFFTLDPPETFGFHFLNSKLLSRLYAFGSFFYCRLARAHSR